MMEIDFWNKWQAEWYRTVTANPGKIDSKTVLSLKHNFQQLDWPLLHSNGSDNQNQKSWEFLPEPYWGDPMSSSLGGVFINFNPGSGGQSQHYQTAINYKSLTSPTKLNPYRIWFEEPEKDYYHAVKRLYKDKEFITTRWMRLRRESFILNFIRIFCSNDTPMVTVKDDVDFAMFELCPWHTKSVTPDVYRYINKNFSLIDQFIIDLALKTCQKASGPFKNLILAHGFDPSTVKTAGLSSLVHLRTHYITRNVSGQLLKKPWTIDVFEKDGFSNCRIINFKNSSNGFPAMTNDLYSVLKPYLNVRL